MEAFATVDDYTERFGEVEDEEVLEQCLLSVTDTMMSEMDAAGIDYAEPSERFAWRLMDICRTVANRIMPVDSEGVMQGVTQMSTTAGPYSQQFTFAASYGTPKLLPSELKRLGVGGGRLGWKNLGGNHD